MGSGAQRRRPAMNDAAHAPPLYAADAPPFAAQPPLDGAVQADGWPE